MPDPTKPLPAYPPSQFRCDGEPSGKQWVAVISLDDVVVWRDPTTRTFDDRHLARTYAQGKLARTMRRALA